MSPDRIDVAHAPADFAALPASRLEAMLAAGEDVVECMRVLAATGDNVVGELLRTEENFYEWDHYPKGDVYDHRTHAQYYYHAHPQEQRTGEHGHFHTFYRAGGIPADIRPAPLADYVSPADPNDDLSHLVAISMDPTGLPMRLFTTNRWVTGETWYDAADVCRLVDRFEIDHARPSWPANRWVTGMLRLFYPQVLGLIRARDERIRAWAAERPDVNAYEDRDLEITAAVAISIDDQLAAIRAALADAHRSG